jgi:Family of unknown function (DUF6370)
MKILLAMLLALVSGGLLITGVPAQEKAKETTLKGQILCAKCALNETKECTTAIMVKDGDKEVTYYLSDKGSKESYHDEVCGAMGSTGSVTGVVSTKDGKKWIAPKKVEYDKK